MKNKKRDWRFYLRILLRPDFIPLIDNRCFFGCAIRHIKHANKFVNIFNAKKAFYFFVSNEDIHGNFGLGIKGWKDITHEYWYLEWYVETVIKRIFRAAVKRMTYYAELDRYHEYEFVDGVIYGPNKKLIWHYKKLNIKYSQEEYADEINKRKKNEINNSSLGLFPYLIQNSRLFTGAIRALALERANYKCEMCGKSSKESTLNVDHIKPYSMGGKTSLANARVLCCDCNIGVYHAKQKHTTGGIA